MPRPRQSHRGVVPGDEPVDRLLRDQLVQQLAERIVLCSFRKPVREPGDDDAQPVLARRDLEARRAFPEHRLFYVEYPSCSRESREKMLRSLVNEIPSKV